MKVLFAEQKRTAAFFDLDGTLTTGPSLEWKYFQALRQQKKISALNYLRWLLEAVRLTPRGMNQIRYANKMYLCEVVNDVAGPDPHFLKQGLEQVAWHARQCHLVVLVTGALEPLAKKAANFLEAHLLRRGIDNAVQVVATQLEESSGKWTGRIVGEACIGNAKAQCLRLLADKLNLNLAGCYAYGDSVHDVPMLSLVGRPATVNASPDLQHVARREGWAAISWQKAPAEIDQPRGIVSRRKSAERLA